MAEEQGHKNEIISDADEKLGQIADMIKDACSKFDSLSSRMDAMEEGMKADARKDADEKEEEGDARKDDDDDARKDARRKDDDEAEMDDDEDMEVAEPGAPREVAADRRKDADEKEEGDHRVADSHYMTRAEADSLRREIASLNRRAPAMLSDMERERFAAIQEQADPAFQAFGDRAPAPLDGETPTQYKRRLGSKLQSNSPKWATSRLSAVADDNMLDVILADVYSDSIAAARRGADVMPGTMREITRQSGGHIINEFVGEPSSWMDSFAGRVNRAS